MIYKKPFGQNNLRSDREKNIFIITLDDNSTIYSDIKIPENYSASIKK